MIYLQTGQRYRRYLLSELDLDTKRNWDNFRTLRGWKLAHALALVWRGPLQGAWSSWRAFTAYMNRLAHVDVRGTTGLPTTPSPAPYAATTLDHDSAESRIYFLALRHCAEVQIPAAYNESTIPYVRFYLEHPLPELPFKASTRQGLADVWDSDVRTRDYCLCLGAAKLRELHAVGVLKWYFVTWMRFHLRFRPLFSRCFDDIPDQAPLLGSGHQHYW